MKGRSFPKPCKIAGAIAALRRPAQSILLAIATLSGVSAAPLSQDLSHGLRYLTLKTLNADAYLAKSSEEKRVLILDLRGASSEPVDGAAFKAWLESRAKPAVPAILLLNQDTDPVLIRLLADTDWPAILTLAPAGVSFPVDIPIDTDAAADQKACAAIARGDALPDLISAKITKDRLDEAKLAKTYETNGRVAARELEEPPKLPLSGATSEASPKVTDLVLARAVQIHRALLALRFLP